MLEQFYEYVQSYDMNNNLINLKYYHSLRVYELSNKIGKSIMFDNESMDIANLIAILHDIGRFEQIKIYNTLIDAKSTDHAQLGVEMLFDKNIIREFIGDNKYDNIIKTAIYYHNKFQLPNDLDKKTLPFCKIIRDADKLDIYKLITEDRPLVINNDDEVTNSILTNFLDGNTADISKSKTSKDRVIFFLSFIFDLNYKYSLDYIIENNYIDKIIAPLDGELKKIIKDKLNDYIDEKIKELS